MWKKTIIWGWWLGPGIFTRNPFPGMWTLPLWLASLHGGSAVLAGALSGLAQGGIRGGVLHYKAIPSSPSEVIVHEMRWRRIDGLALVTISSAAVATLIQGKWF